MMRRQDARRLIVSAAVLVGTMFGCANRDATPFAEPQLPMHPATAPVRSPVAPVVIDSHQFQKMILGQSVEGRAIPMYILPGGATTVLIIGGVHGNEQTSVDVANALLELLDKNPSPAAGRTIAIVPNANPDGYARNSRYNANRIDVNRNFDATNFQPTLQAAFRSGTTPNSEPETRAIVRAIEYTDPQLLISIHSITKGRECNNYDGPAEHIAKIMTEHNGYPAVPTIGYATPGSLGSYAGIDRQIPMITLELPRTLPGEEAWQQNREALIAAIAATR